MTTTTTTTDVAPLRFVLRDSRGEALTEDDFDEGTYWALVTMRFVLDHPAYHDQGTWMRAYANGTCKTAGCLAGWATVLSGAQLHFEVDPYGGGDGRIAVTLGLFDDLSDIEQVLKCGGVGGGKTVDADTYWRDYSNPLDWDHHDTPDGSAAVIRRSIRWHAAQLLRLDNAEARDLFDDACATREDLQEWIEEHYDVRLDDYTLDLLDDPLRVAADQALASVSATTESPEEGK